MRLLGLSRFCKIKGGHVIPGPPLTSQDEDLPLFIKSYSIDDILLPSVLLFPGVHHHLALHEPDSHYSAIKANLDDVSGLPYIRVDELLPILLHPFELVDHLQCLSELASDGEGFEDVQILIADVEIAGSSADEDVGVVVGHAPALPCGPAQRLQLSEISGVDAVNCPLFPCQDVDEVILGEVDAAFQEDLRGEDFRPISLNECGLVEVIEGELQDVVEGLSVESAGFEDVGVVHEGEALGEAGVVVDAAGYPVGVVPCVCFFSVGAEGDRHQYCKEQNAEWYHHIQFNIICGLVQNWL